MTLEAWTARLFRLDDETWMRHANPWSVWTRFTALPLLILAFWSRVWLGWGSVIPIGGAVAWTYLNPRLFPPPSSTRSWASRAVFGERIWACRDRVTVSRSHLLVPRILEGLSGAGGLIVIWAVLFTDVWPLLLGITLVYLSKLWFMDRMVWLYEDHRDRPECSGWEY